MKRWLYLTLLMVAAWARGEDGYRLWLRYDALTPPVSVTLKTTGGSKSPTLEVAILELQRAFGREFSVTLAKTDTTIPASPEAYRLQAKAGAVEISSAGDVGVLYGVFALLRHVQTGGRLDDLDQESQPRIAHRLLNHWDNLNGFVERGWAGFSLWKWFDLPEVRDVRYRDYARALASIGLNGTVLTNVNANALVLTPTYLEKVAALANEFRPYGIRVYLTARFSAPIEIGGLKTADPLDPDVQRWWETKATEIYQRIPDFGGFVVKANSEGQPGPQDYGRSHAQGANLLAKALEKHSGIVMWRAFVYAAEKEEDRVKQAWTEFMPLDGQFGPNVAVQIKNGPLDFMPREPFSPLFGGLSKTAMALELQITQEYLGGSLQLAYVAPLWKEVLETDTYARGPGSSVARAIDGTLRGHTLSVIAGVANTGNDRNWTGHPLAQANWYAFGRLAWDHSLSSEEIADEWIRMTLGRDPQVVSTVQKMLLSSRETVVNYSMPLGLHHIMAEGHHYGPGPWVDLRGAGRPDWTSVYYHRADKNGLGFNRTATGSHALEQYAPELATRWGNVETCPENLLLWFHHVPWDHRMKSGRTLWDELCLTYQRGVDEVKTLQHDWQTLAGKIDEERFSDVAKRLQRQLHDAIIWRDACLLYFQQISQRPLPQGVEKPAHALEYYRSLKPRYVPGHPGDY